MCLLFRTLLATCKLVFLNCSAAICKGTKHWGHFKRGRVPTRSLAQEFVFPPPLQGMGSLIANPRKQHKKSGCKGAPACVSAPAAGTSPRYPEIKSRTATFTSDPQKRRRPPLGMCNTDCSSPRLHLQCPKPLSGPCQMRHQLHLIYEFPKRPQRQFLTLIFIASTASLRKRRCLACTSAQYGWTMYPAKPPTQKKKPDLPFKITFSVHLPISHPLTFPRRSTNLAQPIHKHPTTLYNSPVSGFISRCDQRLYQKVFRSHK